MVTRRELLIASIAAGTTTVRRRHGMRAAAPGALVVDLRLEHA